MQLLASDAFRAHPGQVTLARTRSVWRSRRPPGRWLECRRSVGGSDARAVQALLRIHGIASHFPLVNLSGGRLVRKKCRRLKLICGVARRGGCSVRWQARKGIAKTFFATRGRSAATPLRNVCVWEFESALTATGGGGIGVRECQRCLFGLKASLRPTEAEENRFGEAIQTLR